MTGRTTKRHGSTDFNFGPSAAGRPRKELLMSPTALIARDLRDAETMRLMHRDGYAKYHRNVEEARKRAAKYKEQKR